LTLSRSIKAPVFVFSIENKEQKSREPELRRNINSNNPKIIRENGRLNQPTTLCIMQDAGVTPEHKLK